MAIPVLIPAYNEAESLQNLAVSLEHQTIPVEPLLIDNDSQDGTTEMALNLGFDVLHQKVPGQIPALQKGLSKIGEAGLILITDADTKPAPTWAETLQECARRISKPTLLTGQISFEYPQTIQGQSLRFLRDLYRTARQQYRQAVGLPQRVFGPNMAFAKVDDDVLATIHDLPSYRRGNDLALGHAFLVNGGEVKFVPDKKAMVHSSGDRYPTVASALGYLVHRGDASYGDREKRSPSENDFSVAMYDAIHATRLHVAQV